MRLCVVLVATLVTFVGVGCCNSRGNERGRGAESSGASHEINLKTQAPQTSQGPSSTLSIFDLNTAYKNNLAAANAKYRNKRFRFSGIVHQFLNSDPDVVIGVTVSDPSTANRDDVIIDVASMAFPPVYETRLRSVTIGRGVITAECTVDQPSEVWWEDEYGRNQQKLLEASLIDCALL